MTDVRGKFFVAEATHYGAGGGGQIVLRAVSRGAVNRSFSEATPSGEIKMHVSNVPAFERFHDAIGKEFYVDFTEYTPTADDGHEYVETGANHYNSGRCVECGATEGEHKPAA